MIERINGQKPENKTKAQALPDSSESDLIGQYLTEISQIPLLGAKQEMELAENIESGRISFSILSERSCGKNSHKYTHTEETKTFITTHKNQRLFKDVDNVAPNEDKKCESFKTKEKCKKTLKTKRSDELIQIAEAGKKAYEKLINSNLRLVVYAIKRFYPSQISMDIIQEGNNGLMNAAVKYDRSRGLRFGTMAIPWIRQSITLSISNTANTIRKPIHFQNLERKIFKFTEQYLTQNGKYPDAQIVCQALKISPEQMNDQKFGKEIVVSLSQKIYDDDTELADVLPDKSTVQSTEDSAVTSQLGRDLNKALDTLSERERDIIIKRFLMDKPRTLVQIGKDYKIVRERVRQIEAKTLQKLSRNSVIVSWHDDMSA